VALVEAVQFAEKVVHAAADPALAVGAEGVPGLTVTSLVTVVVVVVVPLTVTEYEIVAVPAATPVTTPALFTVAIFVLPLDQVPVVTSGYLTMTIPEPPFPPLLVAL
jgi:hypothetical protein